MWKENKGFSTIETVSALSTWVLITVMILPMWARLISDEKETAIQETGYQLLHESISTYMLSGEYGKSETIKRLNQTYKVRWEEDGDNQKVCMEAVSPKDEPFCLSILRTDWLYLS
ncbi:competence type IV pilus minor pilin ComGE [Bacillus atrophaeus]|uniref:competence type IV pilus minor pilin ComGE n=1 Tax=Bacillus atrophaeus TaxID=1452 RepID=UPI003EDA68DE